MARPIVIGITGGIASGKSTILACLRESFGFVTLDADKTGHAVYQVDSAGYRAVVARFGVEIVDPATREIMRPELARIVFADPNAMADLERLTHPLILAQLYAEIEDAAASGRDTAIEAIRLFSSGLVERCDEVWFVRVPADVAVDRLARTRGLTRGEALARIEAQQALLADADLRADWRIDGTSDLTEIAGNVGERLDQLRMNRNKKGKIGADSPFKKTSNPVTISQNPSS